MSKTDPHHEQHADGIVEDRETPPPVYFTVLFYGLIIWGVAFMAFYLLSGWSSDAEFQEKMAAHKGETVQARSAAPAPAAAPVTVPDVAPVAAPAAAPVEAPTATPQQPVPVAAATTDIDGAALFRKHCAGCHGAEGKGAFGTDLTGDYTYGKTSLAVQESIALGRPGNMPAFEKKLSPEEIAALADFVLNL